MKRQNPPSNLPFQPAGFLRRLGAVFYDTLALFALSVLAHLPVQIMLGAAILPGDPWHSLYQAYLAGVWFLYLGWCWTHGGQTLGMRAWRVYLRDREIAPVSWRQALIRFVGAMLSWLPLGAGFLWALVDREGMTWHDRLSGTRLARYSG